MARNSTCTKCDLYKNARTVCFWGQGNPQADIMFIGKMPSSHEDMTKNLFKNSPLGQIFDDLLEVGGIDRADIYVTNIVKCYTSGSNHPTKEEKVACLGYLKDEIAAVKPKVIVTMGLDALEALTGESKIMKLAGTVINVDKTDLNWKGKVYVTVNPAYLSRNPSYFSRAEVHFKEIGYFYRGEELPKKNMDSKYVAITKFEQVAPFFEQLHKQSLIAFDTETDSLDFTSGNLLCFSFSWKKNTGVVLPLLGYKKEAIWTDEEFAIILQQLKSIFAKPNIEWIAHNMSFDHKYTMQHIGDIAGTLHDTMLLQHLLDENAKDLKGLKALANVYTTMGKYDDPLDEFKHNLKLQKSKKLTNAKKENKAKIKMIEKVLAKDSNDVTAQKDLKKLKEEEEHLAAVKIDISYDEIPTDILWPYAAMDADATFRIFDNHFKTLQKQSLYFQKYSNKSMLRLYQQLVMPLRRVLDEMEFRGVQMDRTYLDSLDAKYAKRIKELSEQVHKLSAVTKTEEILSKRAQEKAGEKWLSLKSVLDWTKYQKNPDAWQGKIPREPKFKTALEYGKHYGKPVSFNLNSSNHLRVFLYEVLKCPKANAPRTDKGELSTNKDTLELFKDKPGVDVLLENRKITKLHSTYVKGSLAALDSNNRIHTSFNQHITTTGRLSSSQVNLQNIPREDKDIKRAFTTKKNWKIVQFDYAQAEFRMWCQLAGDVDMRNDIIAGLDIHTQTASDFWNIPMKDVTKKQRSAAKAVVFGLMYGRGAASVAKQVGIQVVEAETIKKRFFSHYPMAAKWLRDTQTGARRNLFVTGFFGRIRRLPHASSRAPQEKIAEALRQAVNSPIQGSAADVTGIALIRIRKELLKNNLNDYAQLILTVHDSIVLEVAEEKLEQVINLCTTCMTAPLPGMVVPFIVDTEVGDNWADVETWNKVNA